LSWRSATGKGFRQDFDRNIAPELRISGTINLAHPASANLREDFIRAKPRPY